MNKQLSTDNGIPGPIFLDGFTENILNPHKLHDHEWRRKLHSPGGQTKFRIKYYGRLLSDKNRIITATDFSQALVIAVDVETGQEILLFDGCKHGYDALFVYEYTGEQINNRKAETYYTDKRGNEIFEITISTYNGIDFDEEFGEEVDENGEIELVNGKKVPFEFVKRNGFDTLQILGITANGDGVEIVSEELA